MKKATPIIILVIVLLATAIVAVACNDDTVTDRPTPPLHREAVDVLNGSFDTGDLQGWKVSGNAFSAKYVSQDEQNKWFYNGTLCEQNTGRLVSNEFTVSGSGFLTFRLGGCKNSALTYLSVVDQNDIELYRFANSYINDADPQAMVQYKADIRNALGKKVRIVVVDDSVENVGYIILDDIVACNVTEPSGEQYLSAQDVKPIFEKNVSSEIFNGDFSGGLDGWTIIGEENSFKISHVNGSRLCNRADENAVGVLRSSAFKVGGQRIASVRLGGMKYKQSTYLSVRCVGTNKEVFRTYSNRWKLSDGIRTHLYYIDLSQYGGQSLYFEFVDNARNNVGWISVEDIQTVYDELPNVTDEIALSCNQSVNLAPTFEVMRDRVSALSATILDDVLRKTFVNCFYATIDGVSNDKVKQGGVLRYNDDGTVFCYTGDINAMWLRDSSAQVLPYLQFINQDEQLRLMVRGLLLKQFEQIRRDPYANAFNPDGSVFERKFELDSLCYPVWLATQYYELTGDGSIFDVFFRITANTIVNVFRAEQRHSDKNYEITIGNDKQNGVNSFNPDCGLIWSAYRPSDDVCHYKYFIPGNMFAAVTLERISSIYKHMGFDNDYALFLDDFAAEIRNAIEKCGVYIHPKYGKIYVFETDGYNSDANSEQGKLIMDAANIPSLLSAPWLGYVSVDDELYRNTRAFALSKDNPYYYEGLYACGIGDPHDMVGSVNNPHQDVPVPWHMSIAMQALTSTDIDEIRQCVKYMTQTTDGTYVMHEAFNANDPSQYSREFFTWPCALYAQVLLTKIIQPSVITEI